MQERRLAAIMFTDIVGYTALMGSDEDRAFETLRKNREIHSKLINQFNGTLIKEMGDGMLISFDLASEAVRCAIEIQKAAKTQDILLKIGIHEGEMIFDGGWCEYSVQNSGRYRCWMHNDLRISIQGHQKQGWDYC